MEVIHVTLSYHSTLTKKPSSQKSVSFTKTNIIERNGNFHVSENGCALVLQKDLEYWVIDELIMEACCALKYFPQIEVIAIVIHHQRNHDEHPDQICQNEKDGDILAAKKEMKLADEEDFGNRFFF